LIWSSSIGRAVPVLVNSTGIGWGFESLPGSHFTLGKSFHLYILYSPEVHKGPELYKTDGA